MPDPIDTPARAPRRDGWTPERRRAFLDTLARGHSVALACARAGLSRQAAYKARRRDPAFAHEWQAAQQSARRTAEQAFLDGLPENLREALLGTSPRCELRGSEFFPLDSVRFVKPM